MKQKKSCNNCKHEGFNDKEGSYCKYHKKSLDDMFPSQELKLDEIGCLQWKSKLSGGKNA